MIIKVKAFARFREIIGRELDRDVFNQIRRQPQKSVKFKHPWNGMEKRFELIKRKVTKETMQLNR